MTFVSRPDPSEAQLELTLKQKEALKYLTTNPGLKEFFMPGGSRSGKTFFGVLVCVARALKYPNSRHVICRLRFSHAKTSIWMDTLPKVLRAMGLKNKRDYKLNRTDFVVTFKNGAELWVEGLDNAERVEKMLGREYNTIYYNEISQIPYDTVTTVQSRLAMLAYSKRYGYCKNIALFDCNPGSKRHWSYLLWFLHVDPADPMHKPLSKERIAGLGVVKMNPEDNLANIGNDYLDILNNLPERKKKRFLEGEYSDTEGQIYTNWEVVSKIPQNIRNTAQCTLGTDFGFTTDPAVMLRLYFINKRSGRSQLWIEQLVYARGLQNVPFAEQTVHAIQHVNRDVAFGYYKESGGTLTFDDWKSSEYLENDEIVAAYMDPHEPKSIAEMQGAFTHMRSGVLAVPGMGGQDSIRAGIDWLQNVDMYVTQESSDVIQELETYEYKKDIEGRSTNEPIATDNHAMDALRYGCTRYITKNEATVCNLSVQ